MKPLTIAQDGEGFPKWWFNQRQGDMDVEINRQEHSLIERFPEEKEAHWGVLKPVGKPRMLWDVMIFSFLFFELWLRPFEIVFLPDGGTPPVLVSIASSSTVFFCVDILLNFSTGYVERAQLIMQRRAIVKNYLRMWFWIDTVATVPWDLILGGGDFFALVRFSKATRILKTLRYLKVLRLIKLIKMMGAPSAGSHILRHLNFLSVLVVPVQVAFGFLVLAHANGCIYGIVYSSVMEWEGTTEVSVALERYYECLCWGYSAVVGSPTSWADAAMQTLQVIVMCERLVLIFAFSYVGGIQIMRLQEKTKFHNVKRDALSYLRQHKVSVDTQIQVVYDLQETEHANDMRNHFNDLMALNIPQELRHRICEELWADKLLSLGLIVGLSSAHDEFLPDLTRVVEEEVFASKSVLAREGDLATSAFYILSGQVAVVSTLSPGPIDDFTNGMWIGEKALVNPMLHRSATAVSKTITSAIVVSGQDLHDIIHKRDMKEHFEELCEYKLPWGLCGRCGLLGDHFTDNCPRAASRGLQFATASQQAGTFIKDIFGIGKKDQTAEKKGGQQNGWQNDEDPDALTLEAQGFCKHINLTALEPIMKARGIHNLHDLRAFSLDELSADLEAATGAPPTAEQREKLSPAAILEFQKRAHSFSTALLSGDDAGCRFLCFLSHCKLDAGTEACLMRTELEELVDKNPELPGNGFQDPFFLDSEDLRNLEELQDQVRGSLNLALLCTTNVLTRPWCLVEIWTAVEAGVPIIPVSVCKPGNEFAFPTENFFGRMQRGELLDDGGVQILKDCGITLDAITATLRGLFKRIAVSYSPHKSKTIRTAELKALLLRCRAVP